MLNGGKAAILAGTQGRHAPVIDIATSYKNAQKEALLFEYRIGKGRLLVCTLNLQEEDPAAMWLKNTILSYAESQAFAPDAELTMQELAQVCAVNSGDEEEDSNRAVNKNDITA